MSDLLIVQSEDEVDSIQFKNGLLYFMSHKSFKEKPNQDCIGIVSKDEKCKILIVSDGMGGHQGGEKASKITCESIASLFQKNPDSSLRELVLDGIEIADSKVKDLKIGAGATLTAAIFTDKYVQFFNCGDSVSYLFGSRGKIKYRTIEHSPMGFGIESGIIPDENAEEAQLVEENVVSNGIGFQTVRIEMSQKIEINEGDIIALMSDGVSGHFTLDEIVGFSTSGSFEDRVKEYYELAKENPDKYFGDDNSLILFRL